MIVEEDVLLAGISVKPFALRLDIEIRIMLSRVMGFSNSRWSIDPDSSGGFTGMGCLLVDLEEIN